VTTFPPWQLQIKAEKNEEKLPIEGKFIYFRNSSFDKHSDPDYRRKGA
tara:strand:+ start:465 stop:608 length:144 start_codon:yes stop_codon:yes gene_type:complete